MKALLEQVYGKMKTDYDVDVRTTRDVLGIISDSEKSKVYIEELSQGLSGDRKEGFMSLAENTRIQLLETANNSFSFTAYDTLAMPILRDFYPRLIAPELVTVKPINVPDVRMYFLKGKFKKNTDATYGTNFPSTGTDISQGPSVGISVTATSSRNANPGARTDILAAAGLTTTQSHIEKNFKITGVTDSTSNYTSVTISPDDYGYFSSAVTLDGGTDYISGHIDWDTGYLTWSSQSGEAVSVTYSAICSLEENQINPKLQLTMEPIRLVAELRQIQTEWTLPYEQDMKSLFDLSIQAETVKMIGEQIALDIDREIINELINYNSSTNPTTHTDTFDKNPDATFTGTRKDWYESILPKCSNLGAQVYNTSLMGAANVIAANPLDAAIFESLNTFEYTGTGVDGGDVGYKSATVQGKRWKIVVSSIVPSGTLLFLYKSPDLQRSVYVYAPYIPALLTPYPYAAVPTATVMTRYAKQIIRPSGIATMTVVDTA
jgi:hypothetical protein